MKNDAKMLFCEHGTAPDKNIIKWQNRINPIWGKLFGGCNINRDIPNILKKMVSRLIRSIKCTPSTLK